MNVHRLERSRALTGLSPCDAARLRQAPQRRGVFPPSRIRLHLGRRSPARGGSGKLRRQMLRLGKSAPRRRLRGRAKPRRDS